MNDQCFGQQIFQLRISSGITRSELAAVAGISGSYLAKVETGRSIAPPRATCERLLEKLQVGTDKRGMLLRLASIERGSSEAEEVLPLEVRQLLMEIRRNGHAMPPTFVKRLRTTIRGVVG